MRSGKCRRNSGVGMKSLNSTVGECDEADGVIDDDDDYDEDFDDDEIFFDDD